MDILEFVKVDNCSGSSDDCSYGYDSGSGFGFGSGFGYGYGSGYGSGYGYGYGYGFGYGSGHSNGSGYGNGSGDGDSIKEINHQKVYMIDGVSTIITQLHNNIAKGFVLFNGLELTPCFIVKQDNLFAHGTTLKEAVASLQEKIFDKLTVKDRIEMFMVEFEHNKKYKGQLFFNWHSRLTNSCLMGRNNFIKNNSLSLDDEYTVDEFIELTINSYGRDIIKQLKEIWGK